MQQRPDPTFAPGCQLLPPESLPFENPTLSSELRCHSFNPISRRDRPKVDRRNVGRRSNVDAVGNRCEQLLPPGPPTLCQILAMRTHRSMEELVSPREVSMGPLVETLLSTLTVQQRHCPATGLGSSLEARAGRLLLSRWRLRYWLEQS